MLVSYPILPARQQNDTDDTYFNRILTNHVSADAGRYPVSSLATPQGVQHRWHGGLHLVGNGEPIRAIADGTIVAYRVAAQTENYVGQGIYDTSFVLLRHETQSGQNTTVVFYSLYMHLALRSTLAPDRLVQLPQWLRNATPGPTVQRRANQRVWRKDALGFAGQLYGRETCHFEVFTTNTALNAFWRDSTTIAQGNGGADFFGDAHFVIPANQAFAVRHPRASSGGTHQVNFPGNANYALPLGQAGNNAAQLFVSVRLESGRRITTTYEAGPHATYRQVGAPVQQDDYEYELYRLATALYPDCPSAGFELLRFGRVLSTDTTTRNENWQLVRYNATAVGYINLAAQAVSKLSDADFVHWQGWQRRDEGTAVNSGDDVCDDVTLIALSQATDSDSQNRLRHSICKHPSEWDSSDLATRFARFRLPGMPLQLKAAWDLFEQHVQNMAFWTSTGLPERSVWHFHPLQFVYHYRKCGWLSQHEMLQLIPENVIRKPGSHNSASQGLWESPNIDAAANLLNTTRVALNQALRKFCIQTAIRRACFFGNSTQETSWFSVLRESNGRTPTLHNGWYGRGFLQLTNPDGNINAGNNNYYKYFEFLGRTPRTPPGAQETTWRDAIGTDAHHAAQSAGAYWVWDNKAAPSRQNPRTPQVDSASRYADQAAANQRRTIATPSGTKVWYYNQSFTNSAAAVNYPSTVGRNPPNMNGLVDRSTAFVNALMVLDDRPTFSTAAGGEQLVPENFVRRIPP